MKTSGRKDPITIPLAPLSSVLCCLWFWCGERTRKGRQENKRQERKSGKLDKKKELKRWKAWQGAFSDHLELGSSTKIGAQARHAPYSPSTLAPSQEERLLGEKCKYHSETCYVSYAVQDGTKAWKELLKTSADCWAVQSASQWVQSTCSMFSWYESCGLSLGTEGWREKRGAWWSPQEGKGET